jgi:hypothetical protein
LCRNALLILSKSDEVISILAGRPKDDSFVSDLKDLEEKANLAKDSLTFRGALKHRRGTYRCLSTGISYGGGATVSYNF